MTATNYLETVRAQYEDFPFPERDPADEKQRLNLPLLAAMDRVGHWCYSGKRNLIEDGARILIAGGGTGDATILLAEQFREVKAEIVYIDISTASMEIAKARAAARNLENITWIHDSLLNIPKLNLGTFDYINCSGVLHHLESPGEGMRVLASVLREDGAMSLLLYGTYGRAAIYQMQQLMQMVCRPEDSGADRIRLCRSATKSVTPDHWLNLSERNHRALEAMNDTELYDMFLHSQDRSYTVPELHTLVEKDAIDLEPVQQPTTEFIAVRPDGHNRLRTTTGD